MIQIPSVGDKVWIFQEGYPIVIRCTVENVDEHDDIDVDEPIGHDLTVYDCFYSKEEAIQNLIEWYNDWCDWMNDPEHRDEYYPMNRNMSLDEFRRIRRDFIASTQVAAGVDPVTEGVWLFKYTSKDRSEWANLVDAQAALGMPLADIEQLYGEDD